MVEFNIEEIEKMMNENNGFITNMGMKVTEVKEGFCRGRIYLEGKHLNPRGTVHGGLIFGLSDTIAGIAAMSYGSAVVTLNANICYLNPAVNTEYIEAEASVVRNGKTTAVYDVMIRTAEGVDVAKVTTTYYKIEGDSFDRYNIRHDN